MFLKDLEPKNVWSLCILVYMNLFVFICGKYGYLIILFINTLVLDIKIGNLMPLINSLNFRWNQITY